MNQINQKLDNLSTNKMIKTSNKLPLLQAIINQIFKKINLDDINLSDTDLNYEYLISSEISNNTYLSESDPTEANLTGKISSCF